MNIFKTISYKSDKDTINSNYGNMFARYHYSFIENAIMQNIASCKTVLDVGPGHGHWIEFYQDVYSSEVDFIDISRRVQIDLRKRYGIKGHIGSIHRFNKGRYDIVNAIGVLHHILNDRDLIRAIENIKLMSDTVIIGTAFDTARNDKHRRFRPLEFWREHFDCEVISPSPRYCKRHLDLIIATRKD